MKIMGNCLGFSDIKWIKVSENLMSHGLKVACIGIASAITGLCIHRNTTEWNHANGIPEAEQYFREVHDELHKDEEVE